jgi:hypothetical protein
MIIANPIYDVVFKRLMENEKVAKFFVGTLLEQTIEAIEVKPQEYTYEGEFDFNNPKDVAKYENRLRERFNIWVYRLDFLATIRTETGELKKVLIEIQKAKNPIDLIRFRNYLAEQYKKEDSINGIKTVLPITTIYILGFKLPEIESPCIKVERNYKDLINKTIIEGKSDFVERLTHDSFVVQVARITNRYQTRLDKLLSVFAQENFVDDNHITKSFMHKPDTEELRIMTDILHYVGTDPAERKKIEDEQEALRTIDVIVGRYQEVLQEKEKAIYEKEKAIYEKDKALQEINQALTEKDQALTEKDQALTEKDQALTEINQALTEKDQALTEKDQALTEKDQALTEKDQALTEKDQALTEKDQALTEKDQALTEKDQALTEKDRLIEELLKKLNQQQ